MPIEGRTKKQEIDLISAYSVTLRERCGVSFYILQQENRNSASSEKIKADMTDCSLDGLKDSGNTGNDKLIYWILNIYKCHCKTPLNKELLAENLVLILLEIKEKAKRLEVMLNIFACYKIFHESGALFII